MLSRLQLHIKDGEKLNPEPMGQTSSIKSYVNELMVPGVESKYRDILHPELGLAVMNDPPTTVHVSIINVFTLLPDL